MSRWIIRLVIILVLIIVLEFYAFQAIKTITKSKIARFSWLFVSIAVYANFFYVSFLHGSK